MFGRDAGRILEGSAIAWCLLVLVSISGVNGNEDPDSGSPAQTRLAEFLAAINEGGEKLVLFSSEAYADSRGSTIRRRREQSKRYRADLGTLSLHEVVRTSDESITALVNAAKGSRCRVTILVEKDEPHRIRNIDLSPMDSPEVDLGPLTAEERNEVVERIAQCLETQYVFPDVGDEMAALLRKHQSEGDYSDVSDINVFASRLTRELRAVCHDKHLRVRAGSPPRRGGSTHRPPNNYGFARVEMLADGVGYLKFDQFDSSNQAKEVAAAALKSLAGSKALIFDIRENGGGSPVMIAFLSSYLFDKSVLLNRFYNRPSDTTTETWTQAEVPGQKFGEEMPVYILTSKYTFSAAEEFTYNLKHMKRATIVGETTGGGAHPITMVALGGRMGMSVPFARAINPVTKTNWEGVGVKPHVEVPASEALDKARSLALEAIAKSENQG